MPAPPERQPAAGAPVPEAAGREAARLARFCSWLAVAAAGYGGGELAMAAVTGERLWAVTGSLTLGFLVLALAARRAARRGLVARAAGVLAWGMLGLLVVLAAVMPTMAPLLAVATLLALTVALPYVRGPGLRRLAIGSTAAAALILVMGAFGRPLTVPLPSTTTRFILWSGIGVTVVLVGLLLWQFSQRLNDALEERAAAHAALRDAYQRLQDADRTKSEFLNAVSHELRTPLTPILLQLEMLDRWPSGSPEHRKSRSILHRNFQRLDRLVDDLLDIARLEVRDLRVERRPFDLRQVLGDAVETFREAYRQAGVALELRPAPGPLHAAGDAERVGQVLTNLLSNALKFTPAGGRVEVAAEARGAEVRVEVRDTGIGVPPEERGGLFQPFVKLPSGETRSPGGMGLGLFLSRRIVEAHGGRIWCESPQDGGQGPGATFVFTLPAAGAAARPPAAA